MTKKKEKLIQTNVRNISAHCNKHFWIHVVFFWLRHLLLPWDTVLRHWESP